MRQKIGFIAGPLLGCLVASLPLPALSPEGHRLAGIITCVIIFWITEPIPIPVTGLLGVALTVVTGVASAQQALASFGDPIIFLFLGSFLMAKAMQVHGVDRRLAYRLLANPWVGGSTYRTLFAFALVAWLLAMWMSITACAVMLLPVALEIGKATEDSPRFNTTLLLTLTYAASAGALATPIGTPPNLIGIEYIHERLGLSIGFLQWMMFGLPLALVLLVTRLGLVLALFRPPARKIPGEREAMRRLYDGLGRRTPGQRNTLIVFALAIVLWITPGLLGLALGYSHPAAQIASARLSPSVVALLMASLLFFLPVDWRRRKFTLAWDQAVQIDWGTILMFGSGLALGKMMLDTGLAEVVGKGILGSATGQPAVIIIVAIVVTVIISEAASNTAAANMVIPVMLSLVAADRSLGLAVALATTFGASVGFILPVSTPANAVVYGSGKLSIRDMARAGLLADLTGILVIWAFAVWVVPYLGF